MVNLEYIIVGTGRCGTKTINGLFNSNGIRCGHESIFGISRKQRFIDKKSIDARLKLHPKLKAESSWLAVPFLNTGLILPDKKIVHLTRNPIDVIKSFVELELFDKKNVSSEYAQYIKHYCPLFSYMNSPYVNAMYYYYYWNNLIEDKMYNYDATFHVKLEDTIENTCKTLGFNNQVIEIMNQKKNKKKIQLSREQVFTNISKHAFFDKFKDFCTKYNYEL